jgi:hypothetical protein
MNKTIRFSIESTKLPGPVPFFLSKKVPSPTAWAIPMTLPRKYFEAVGEALGKQMAFLNNQFILGPSIPRGSGEESLRKLARRWVDWYGFDFLTPVLNRAMRISVSIDRLFPKTAFEQQIVDCMRRALRED